MVIVEVVHLVECVSIPEVPSPSGTRVTVVFVVGGQPEPLEVM